jgi:hypothetical protein
MRRENKLRERERERKRINKRDHLYISNDEKIFYSNFLKRTAYILKKIWNESFI